MHTLNYRHSSIIDVDNAFGHGYGAIICQGGPDRSVVEVMAPDILSFLE